MKTPIRRSAKLFDELSRTKNDKAEPKARQKPKGRSTKLLENRDNKMAHRYYYYTKIVRYNYDDTLQALENDFDITISTIVERIQLISEKVRQVRDKKLSRADLKRIYPGLNWNHKAAPEPVAIKKEEFILS